jgi:hypothetical protein
MNMESKMKDRLVKYEGEDEWRDKGGRMWLMYFIYLYEVGQ